MTVLNYRRHFGWLAGAVLVLMVLQHLPIPPLLDGLTYHCALDSVLHALAVLFALNVGASLRRCMAFGALAALLGSAVPWFGLLLARALDPQRTDGVGLAFALAAAGGAAAYWLLVRSFWMRGLGVSSLLLAVALCTASTAASFALTAHSQGDLFWWAGLEDSVSWLILPTVPWWLAFSLSLYLAERAGMTAQIPVNAP